MLPAKRNKIDISKLSDEEKTNLRLYGQLPTHHVPNYRVSRKYFDSGDYALSKAGVAPQTTVGTAIPNPQNIPHLSQTNSHNSLSVSPTNSTSPVKESALSHDPQAGGGPANDTDVGDADVDDADAENPVDNTIPRLTDANNAETA